LLGVKIPTSTGFKLPIFIDISATSDKGVLDSQLAEKAAMMMPNATNMNMIFNASTP
jgi:hypothetical protein